MQQKTFLRLLPLTFLLALSWCNRPTTTIIDDNGEKEEIQDKQDSEINPEELAKISSYFDDAALVDEVTLVDCILSDGTESSCYQIVVTNGVTDADIWPRCPRNIADDATAGWIWLDGGEVYDVDGEFIKNLATFYEDDAWKLYDEATWDINVTDSKEAFEWAAKPQVEEQYKNHCVEGLLSYLDETPTEIYVIPKDPVKSETVQSLSNPIWIAFNGIRFDAPAPVDAILAANTIAAFDDCGGHVNPVAGYHYHAETWCAPRVTENEDHEQLIGFALDGFELYEHNDEITDLDECGWHTDEVRWYHYHIADAGQNQHLWCLSWGYWCVLSEEGTCDATASANWRRWPPPGGENGERAPRPEVDGDEPVWAEVAIWAVAKTLGLNNEDDKKAWWNEWAGEGFLWSYEISDNNFGTQVKVAVAWDIRSITSNALPNHETGVFPNEENPNTISAQESAYELPTTGEFVWTESRARDPWVAVNGIKIEPETAERVECESGEVYRIEAKQSTFPVIGLDDQNAHVQPTGTYHYHWISEALVAYADTGEDLVHVWFAKDGFNIYYSKSWAYKTSFGLSDEIRTGTTCAYRGTAVDIDGTSPDGTYVSDWVFDESLGDLDSCNWTTIDGEYAYLMTDSFPYTPRCLNGEVAWGWGPGGGWWGWQGWPPPGGQGWPNWGWAPRWE